MVFHWNIVLNFYFSAGFNFSSKILVYNDAYSLNTKTQFTRISTNGTKYIDGRLSKLHLKICEGKFHFLLIL